MKKKSKNDIVSELLALPLPRKGPPLPPMPSRPDSESVSVALAARRKIIDCLTSCGYRLSGGRSEGRMGDYEYAEVLEFNSRHGQVNLRIYPFAS